MRSQRFSRSLTNRVLGGVCGGLGAYLGMNPWWIRAAFLILGVLTAGTGVLIYLALWLMLPAENLTTLSIDSDARTNPETLVVIGFIVVVMGLVVLARNVGVLVSEHGDAFLPLVIIVFGLMLLVNQLRRAA